MKKVLNVLKQINPFSSKNDNGKVAFFIQKILAFCLIYEAASLLMEGVVIILFMILGYDAIHGIMPTGTWAQCVPHFGFLGFIIITILYVKFIEKKTIKDMKLSIKMKHILYFIATFIVGGILVAAIIGFIMMLKAYSYEGYNSGAWCDVLLLSFAYIIQAAAEEVMCRGFVQNILAKRLGVPAAIAGSALVFILPHALTIFDFSPILIITSLINIILVSILFSLIMIKYNSVLASIGFHAGWNIVLNLVFGLVVSGGDIKTSLVNVLVNKPDSVVFGGQYGMEASLILIPILLVIDIIMIFVMKKKGGKLDGVRE